MRFNNLECKFLKPEFAFERETLETMSEDELWNLQEQTFDIECDEVLISIDNDDAPLSKRGKRATMIVDRIYKVLTRK